MDTTTLQRLLKYPHAAVFSKDPQQELAFLLRHPAGDSTWRVAERHLIVTADDQETVYQLGELSVEDLAEALQADGFLVTNLSAQYRHLSALALVEAAGSELSSNGDRLYVFTSLLWVLLSAYAAEVALASDQVQQALRQMVITTSEGEWLDLWGTLYADARLSGESDASYAARIPVEAFRLRNNARAIELAILDATGFDVRIEEPWQKIFRLDESLLSGPHKFYDGEFIGPHLIQPVTNDAINWPAVLEVINRNRAAGVMVLGPRINLLSHVDATGSPFVHFAGIREPSSNTIYEDRALLDFSTIEEVSIPNRAAWYRREINHQSIVAVPQTYIAHPTNWSRDYRVYYLAIYYESQRWDTTNGRTWGDLPPETWRSLTATISSGHTRES